MKDIKTKDKRRSIEEVQERVDYLESLKVIADETFKFKGDNMRNEAINTIDEKIKILEWFINK